MWGRIVSRYGIMIAVIMLGFTSPFALQLLNTHTYQVGSGTSPANLLVAPDDHVYGSPNAVIQIFEYSDVECSYCKELQPLLFRLVSEYPETVSIVYRHFPLGIHPKAYTESLALECVAQIAGEPFFWTYLRKLFEITPSNNNIDLAELPRIAGEMGIDEKLFSNCLYSEGFKDRVDRDLKSGSALGVDSVPHLFMRHARTGSVIEFSSMPTYYALKESVEALLSINSNK